MVPFSLMEKDVLWVAECVCNFVLSESTCWFWHLCFCVYFQDTIVFFLTLEPSESMCPFRLMSQISPLARPALNYNLPTFALVTRGGIFGLMSLITIPIYASPTSLSSDYQITVLPKNVHVKRKTDNLPSWGSTLNLQNQILFSSITWARL